PKRNAMAAIDAASRVKRPCVESDLTMVPSAYGLPTACVRRAGDGRRGWGRASDEANRGDLGVWGSRTHDIGAVWAILIWNKGHKSNGSRVLQVRSATTQDVSPYGMLAIERSQETSRGYTS